MGVDQTGKQGGLVQVDDLGVGGRVAALLDRYDLPGSDQYHPAVRRRPCPPRRTDGPHGWPACVLLDPRNPSKPPPGAEGQPIVQILSMGATTLANPSHRGQHRPTPKSRRTTRRVVSLQVTSTRTHTSLRTANPPPTWVTDAAPAPDRRRKDTVPAPAPLALRQRKAWEDRLLEALVTYGYSELAVVLESITAARAAVDASVTMVR